MRYEYQYCVCVYKQKRKEDVGKEELKNQLDLSSIWN